MADQETSRIELQSGAWVEAYDWLTYGAQRHIKRIYSELYDVVNEAGGDADDPKGLTLAAQDAGVSATAINDILDKVHEQRFMYSVTSWSWDMKINLENLLTRPGPEVMEVFTALQERYAERMDNAPLENASPSQ